MAHKTSKPSCSNKKEQFLFDKVPFQQFLSKSTLFRFFKFGSNCNGNAGHSFSGATCDLKRKIDQNESQWYGILMSQLFESGYSFLQSKLDSKKSTCFDERMTALKTLIKFFAEKEIHEKNIQNALEKMNSTENKESVLVKALAEHLFGKLSPGQQYVVDSTIKYKGNNCQEKINNKCKCGCDTEICYGATGIGHADVWHGFVDIMMTFSDQKPESTASVYLALNDDGPSRNKKMKISDGNEEDDDNILCDCVLESYLNKVQDKATAETVVFALAYQITNPSSTGFIPHIIISPNEFYIVMYEPVHDVLLWSSEFPLISQSDCKLQGVSIIALWMVLHYKLFCNGVDELFDDVGEIKADFSNQLDVENLDIYKKKLEIGVQSFGATPHINLVHSLREVDFVFPKLKLRK
ncbi:uncharacterized protein LOC143067219 isoform X1 [Mytilus galloprovincialis]|uniref:uncharacterized protein LOC143067219 isoform X1 n=2 Tax=Mytilus galloprovincialis TaxID=29158 RepID=UPI003F7BFC34